MAVGFHNSAILIQIYLWHIISFSWLLRRDLKMPSVGFEGQPQLLQMVAS